MKKALSQQQKELDKAEKRINELDILFRKLYEVYEDMRSALRQLC